MFSILAVVAVQASPPVEPGPADDVAVLAAFREVCWDVPETSRVLDNATAHDWVEVDNGEDPRVDRMRSLAESENADNYRVTVRLFRRHVGNRELLLNVERGELTAPAADGFGSTNCQIRELSDPRPLPIETIAAWIGRPAESVIEDRDGSTGIWYSVGGKDPTILTLGYFPPTSSLVGAGFLPGIYLNAEAYGDHNDVNPR